MWFEFPLSYSTKLYKCVHNMMRYFALDGMDTNFAESCHTVSNWNIRRFAHTKEVNLSIIQLARITQWNARCHICSTAVQYIRYGICVWSFRSLASLISFDGTIPRTIPSRVYAVHFGNGLTWCGIAGTCVHFILPLKRNWGVGDHKMYTNTTEEKYRDRNRKAFYPHSKWK